MGIVKNTLYQEFHCPQTLLLEDVVEFVSYSSSDFPPLYKKSIPVMSMMAQTFIMEKIWNVLNYHTSYIG